MNHGKPKGTLPIIKATVTTAEDVDCRIMEIDENLVRSELDPLERSRLLETRKRLYDAKGGTTRPTPGGKQKTGFAKDVCFAIRKRTFAPANLNGRFGSNPVIPHHGRELPNPVVAIRQN